jgi:hypothetical protein
MEMRQDREKERLEWREREEEMLLEDVYDIYRPRGLEDNALMVFDCAGTLPSSRLVHHLTALSCLTRMQVVTVRAKTVLKAMKDREDALVSADPVTILNDSEPGLISSKKQPSIPLWEQLLTKLPMHFGADHYYKHTLFVITQMNQVEGEQDEQGLQESMQLFLSKEFGLNKENIITSTQFDQRMPNARAMDLKSLNDTKEKIVHILKEEDETVSWHNIFN